MTQLFTEIEHARTAARVNVASGLRGFLQTLRSVEAVRSLASLARNDRGIAAAVLTRLIELAQRRIDPRYENPHDVGIAAYLLVLSTAAPDLIAIAADAVSEAENCWWAVRAAQSSAQESLKASGDDWATVTMRDPSRTKHYLPPGVHRSVDLLFSVGSSSEELVPARRFAARDVTVYRATWSVRASPGPSGDQGLANVVNKQRSADQSVSRTVVAS